MDISNAVRRAKEISAEYNPEGLVPFPFQRMAERLNDVDLLFFGTSNASISGATLFQNDRFTIIVNNNKPETRQYFTTAHEFGHYFLHGDWLRENPHHGFVDYGEQLDGQGMLLREDDPTETTDPQKEREANNFAAELIMPEDKVRAFWELTKDIAKCAETFQVSKAAMAIRLERLHLLS